MYIGCIGLEGKFSRDVAVVFVSAGGCFVGFTIEFGFSHGLFSPYASIYIGSVFFGVEIGSGH